MKKSPLGSKTDSEDPSRNKAIPVGLINVQNVHQECDKTTIVGILERPT